MNIEYGCKESFYVPDEYKWLAWDMTGECYAYINEPVLTDEYWSIAACPCCGMENDDDAYMIGEINPPEPGNWNEQLYYIGE